MTQLSASVLSKPSDTPSSHATTRAGAEAGAVAVIIATAAKKTAPEPVDIWHVTSESGCLRPVSTSCLSGRGVDKLTVSVHCPATLCPALKTVSSHLLTNYIHIDDICDVMNPP